MGLLFLLALKVDFVRLKIELFVIRNLFLVRNIEVWDPKFHILQTNECFYERLLKEHCRCTFLPRVILMNVRTFSPPVSSLGSSIALPNVILSLSSKNDINQTISKQ